MLKSIYLFLVLSFVIYCDCQSQTISLNNTQVIFQLQQYGTQAGYPVAAQILPRTANNTPITGCAFGNNPFIAKTSVGLQTIYPDSCQPNVMYPYVITFSSDQAKNYSVNITYQNQLVGQSPYEVGFTYGPISPNNSYAIGPGLERAKVGEDARFFFKTFDQFNNEIKTCLPAEQWATDFSIVLEQPVYIYGEIDSCDNSTYVYSAHYMTTSTDPGFLFVTYLGNNFNDMPRTPSIISGDPYGPTCVHSSDDFHNVTSAGVPETFTLECTDQFGNSLTNCSLVDLDSWHVFYNSSETNVTFFAERPTCAESGLFKFTYQSIKAALYTTYPYYNTTDNAVPSFTTLIKPGPANETKAVGAGVEYNNPNNIAGVPTYFNILSADQYGNTITGCLNESASNWNVLSLPEMDVPPQPPVCINNVMTSNWTATDADADYFIYVALNSHLAEGSPYKTNVFSNLLTGSSSVLLPLNTTQIGAGYSLTFNVKGFDQYGNEITNCSRATMGLFTVKATNSVNTSIVITGNMNCYQVGNKAVFNGTVYGTLIGTYSLAVKYNSVLLKDSPQTFIVTPGAMDARLSYATGDGFNSLNVTTAGTALTFYVHQVDKYGNAISTCLPVGYEWDVHVFQYPPYKVQQNGTLPSKCNVFTGVYTITYKVTLVGSFVIQVFSIKDNNFTSEVEIRNEGGITVFPGPFSADNSVVLVSPNAEVGDHVPVSVTPYDEYKNPLLTCTLTLANDLKISARLSNIVVSTGDMYCNGTLYTGHFLANLTGNYQVQVLYYTALRTLQVGQTKKTTVIPGAFSPSTSIAVGPGVGIPVNGESALIVAGTNASIYIQAMNKNGFPLQSSSAVLLEFSFYILGLQDGSVIYNVSQLVAIPGEGYLYAYYNATVAQPYNVTILYNGQALGNERDAYYIATVVAAAIDLNTLTATNIESDDSGNGNFDLSATDAFGNPVVFGAGLEATLAPACSYTNVTCGDPSVQYTCGYSVQESGVYCITVVNSTSLAQYPVGNSTILVAGGVGCDDLDSCNQNGVCFPVPGSQNYQCNCKGGYTGSTCETKIKSKYMNLWLGVGLLIGLSILLLVIGVVLGCLIGRRGRGQKNLLN